MLVMFDKKTMFFSLHFTVRVSQCVCARVFGWFHLVSVFVPGEVGLCQGSVLTLLRLPPRKLCTASEDPRAGEYRGAQVVLSGEWLGQLTGVVDD